jgi:hypothetical protein
MACVRGVTLITAWIAASNVALLLALHPALANDSAVELAVGGIVFSKTADVSMEEENLTISPETVDVVYHFLNQTAEPVTLTVAFPLPDIDLSETDVLHAIPGSDPVNFVDFKTKIDGKSVKLEPMQRAHLGSKDVTSAIKTAGLPLLMLSDTQKNLAAISPESKQKLIDTGLLIPSGSDSNGAQTYGPAWTVSTSFIRKQVFPAGKQVVVEHHYKTSLGAMQDTPLRRSLRTNEAMATMVDTYKKDYCIPDDFLGGIDKIAGGDPTNIGKLEERRVDYVLTTGANWAGPIKSFKLTVDKGRPDRLVSFCFDNVKKVSPTNFEAVIQDFTPKQDLKILLVGKY